jgi:sugar phosphate isomerase/epimerase
MHPVTYCTNIHPGEALEEIREGIAQHARKVRAALCPAAPFPLGLRLSGRASRELAAGDKAREMGEWLAANGFYVVTVNGFPYGRFHDVPVKEAVYLPDWRDPERLAYTLRLARILASWLPDGGIGSVSTVPLGFRRNFPQEAMSDALSGMRRALSGLAGLYEETGRRIRLAVEAEPGCLVETTPEMAELFERMDAPSRLMNHMAVCYDCCHQALQYEEPEESLACLATRGIPIGHVQVSSALHLDGGDLSVLARFVEPVYLHQAVARRDDGTLLRFDDLPQALAAPTGGIRSWRVHFHLPVFVADLPECRTTQPFLRRILPLFPESAPLEVETYTWGVLPPELKTGDVADSVVREIAWVNRARGRSE